MSDRTKVIVGLILFLALAAFPIWYPLGAEGDVTQPELELPEDATECVEDTEYMTANHMDLLNQWRNAVVRDGQRDYTASSGEVFNMSLTETCLGCHENRDAFCTRCHDYANVSPKCWDCHVEPAGGS